MIGKIIAPIKIDLKFLGSSRLMKIYGSFYQYLEFNKKIKDILDVPFLSYNLSFKE